MRTEAGVGFGGSKGAAAPLAGSARGRARSHLHAPCRWYWFEATPRDLGGEREGRSPLASPRTVQVVLVRGHAPRSWRGARGAEPARKTTQRTDAAHALGPARNYRARQATS